jgi:DNA-binding NarL/FixJ family response regulator
LTIANRKKDAGVAISVLVIDDHPLILSGMETLLGSTDDCYLAAACLDAESGLRALRAGAPDVMLLDLHLPDRHGLALLKDVRKEKIPVKTVIMSGRVSDDELMEAIRLGVNGVVRKDLPLHLLLRCLRTVYEGGQWLEKQSVARALEKLLTDISPAQQALKTLTAREIEMARLAALGLGNQAIGVRLFVSEGTVKAHLHSVFKKLHVKNRVEMSLLAQSLWPELATPVPNPGLFAEDPPEKAPIPNGE